MYPASNGMTRCGDKAERNADVGDDWSESRVVGAARRVAAGLTLADSVCTAEKLGNRAADFRMRARAHVGAVLCEMRHEYVVVQMSMARR